MKECPEYVRKALVRKKILLKSFREQNKRLFFNALIRAIRGAVADSRCGDFVYWYLVERQIDDWVKALDEEKW